MNCADLRPLISAYVDSELWPAQREMIALHLERCPTCQTYLIGHQRARHLLTSCTYPGWAPDLRDAVRARLASERHTHLMSNTTVDPLHWIPRRIVGPFCLALIGLSCFLIGRMSPLSAVPQAVRPASLDGGLASCTLAWPSPDPAGRLRRPQVTPSVPRSLHHLIMVLPCPASTVTDEVMVVESSFPDLPGGARSPLAVHRCRDMRCVQQAVRAAIGSTVQEVTLPVLPARDETEQPRSRRGLPLML